MIHTKRVFCVATVATAEELAEKLTQHSWTLCTGFEYAGLLFLNDSFSEDGAAEFAVVRDGRQVESITFSWCTEAKALKHINEAAAGPGCDMGAFVPRLERTGHRCELCA